MSETESKSFVLKEKVEIFLEEFDGEVGRFACPFCKAAEIIVVNFPEHPEPRFAATCESGCAAVAVWGD